MVLNITYKRTIIGSNLINPLFKVAYLAPCIRRTCVASKLLAQIVLFGEDMIEYITYHEALTISLNFRLSKLFDMITELT